MIKQDEIVFSDKPEALIKTLKEEMNINLTV
jgi:hypothetical protein